MTINAQNIAMIMLVLENLIISFKHSVFLLLALDAVHEETHV